MTHTHSFAAVDAAMIAVHDDDPNDRLFMPVDIMCSINPTMSTFVAQFITFVAPQCVFIVHRPFDELRAVIDRIIDFDEPTCREYAIDSDDDIDYSASHVAMLLDAIDACQPINIA